MRRQRGAVAVMVAASLFVILAMCGLAIDLGLMFNRRAELQKLADATALAAAAELDGTQEGIARALASAASTAAQQMVMYRERITWTDAAMQFGKAPGNDGAWAAADAARAAPDGRLYARVDTQGLDTTYGLVRTIFMNVLGSSRDAVMQGLATAGRTGINVTPLAICANADTRASRGAAINGGNELVEFGFRRGVSYNLLRLNPHGLSPNAYLVNPFAPPGTVGDAAPTANAIIGPSMCTGTMPIPRVMGGAITVVRITALGGLEEHLNSRFDRFPNNKCSRFSAAPDMNIKDYTYGAVVNWMSPSPLGQGASESTAGDRLLTIADVAQAAGSVTAGMYGPLWSYAKAVAYSAQEPSGGYASYATTDWNTLYNPGNPAAAGYSDIPYWNNYGSSLFQGPSGTLRGSRNRRVLNIPLLHCAAPVTGTGTDTVVGIGKFFMTVPATGSALYAEFAGTVPEQGLGPSVGLFP
jgi:Flp pilus assembly protein TadG